MHYDVRMQLENALLCNGYYDIVFRSHYNTVQYNKWLSGLVKSKQSRDEYLT